jgi:hypothetical protein
MIVPCPKQTWSGPTWSHASRALLKAVIYAGAADKGGLSGSLSGVLTYAFSGKSSVTVPGVHAASSKLTTISPLKIHNLDFVRIQGVFFIAFLCFWHESSLHTYLFGYSLASFLFLVPKLMRFQEPNTIIGWSSEIPILGQVQQI